MMSVELANCDGCGKPVERTPDRPPLPEHLTAIGHERLMARLRSAYLDGAAIHRGAGCVVIVDPRSWCTGEQDRNAWVLRVRFAGQDDFRQAWGPGSIAGAIACVDDLAAANPHIDAWGDQVKEYAR